MVVVFHSFACESSVLDLERQFLKSGCRVYRYSGKDGQRLGIVGPAPLSLQETVPQRRDVASVFEEKEPFKLAGRSFHPTDRLVQVGPVTFGGSSPLVIAGPCSVESLDQVLRIAQAVAEKGAHLLRAGAYKPRTSPYSFQGLEEKGLEYLAKARAQTGLRIVTEAMGTDSFAQVEDCADLIQIGARNMQNFPLLKRCGKSQKPILLKRGLCATIEELLMAAEYILAHGNPNVILCERGIRTFETFTRNTLDISAISAVRHLSALPIITDPSHGAGRAFMVEPLAKASLAAGAHGVMVEVHDQPQQALSDAEQALNLEEFDHMMQALSPYLA